MEIILINHARRVKHEDPARDKQIDRHQPLHDDAKEQVSELVGRLKRGSTPTLYLTSRNLHARETANLVCEALGGNPSRDVVEIDALTPHHPTESFEQVIEQATAVGHDPRLHLVVAIVGHSPRLNSLFAHLTWEQVASKALGEGQEVRLEAESFQAFRDGKGRGQWP
jgi:phosphohistidine phosphatase SixA